jgi:hypothetical protein
MNKIELIIFVFSMNSFLVLFDNLIKFAKNEKLKKEIFEINFDDEITIRSIVMSLVTFLIEIAILIFLNKNLVILVLFGIIIIHFITLLLKLKNMKYLFKINVIVYDVTIFIRPFLYQYIYLFCRFL